MVLGLKKFISGRALCLGLLLLGCTQAERDNIYDQGGVNYDPNTALRYSSSVPSSSSSAEPSSSDTAPISSSIVSSSSSAPPSSSGTAPISSSILSSSSSAPPSSSSVVPSSSSNVGCAGFVIGAKSSHYGKEKEQFCDERDGKKYVYVKIGTQTWMAENLNYNASGSKCYGDNSGGDSQNKCDTYGRLYNWNTAMNNASSSTSVPSGVKGVCPSDWHLPSRAEWNVLGDDAKKLKATSGWEENGNGTDDYGFSALPGGYSFSLGFYDVGDYGYWWSATSDNSIDVYRWYMGSNGTNPYWVTDIKSNLFSVRCLKD
jgi:uncharacterized protein (TIGR02145 family)